MLEAEKVLMILAPSLLLVTSSHPGTKSVMYLNLLAQLDTDISCDFGIEQHVLITNRSSVKTNKKQLYISRILEFSISLRRQNSSSTLRAELPSIFAFSIFLGRSKGLNSSRRVIVQFLFFLSRSRIDRGILTSFREVEENFDQNITGNGKRKISIISPDQMLIQ